MANIVPQTRVAHELGVMGAPAAGRGTTAFYQREKKGSVCDFAVTDQGKVFRLAQYDTDGCLHLRPANAGSGLDVDANGYVKVVYDKAAEKAAMPGAQEQDDFEYDEDERDLINDFRKALTEFAAKLGNLTGDNGN